MTMGIYDKYKKLVLPANIIKTQITKSLPGGAPGTIVSGGLGNEGVDLVVWTQERIDDNSIKIAGLTELIQLTGVPQYSTNLGTFSGTIIPDNTTIKNALQVLEVALMNATGGGSTGGIYGGSGFISTQAVATVTDTFSIKADSVGKLIQLGDVNNDFPGSNFSLGGTGIKIMPGNSVTIGGPFSNTFQPYIQVTKIETNIKQTEDDYIRLHRTAVSELRTSKQYFNISTPFAGSFKGLMYELDYSANFGPRSLVDKGYVDSKFQSIPDGDKGDITVSNTGSVWTINNGIVTFSKMQNVTTQTLLGRYDAGSGTIQEIVLGSGLSLIGNTLVASGGGGGGTGFVPTTRTLTINGVTYDLSANRTWNINSMVYPPAGIPVSTGSAWGTSIADYSTNWNTAFSWGNHALAGYLTSYTETDPTVPSHVKSISSTNISNWNTAYSWNNHALAGYLTGTAIGTTVQPYNANTVVDAAYVHTDNNYTTAEKSKLAGIQPGAEVNVNADWNSNSGDSQILNKPTIPTTFDNLLDGVTNKAFTATEKTKLAGIAAGAEVNVNADWNATSGDAQILNKPTIPTQVLVDAIPTDGSNNAVSSNGVFDALASKADLVGGKVPTSQLPSYVDDVIEGYYNAPAFYSDAGLTTIINGETGKIYVDLLQNRSYRWTGSLYIQISNAISSINDLTDVTIASPNNGQILRYNSTNAQWENVTVPIGNGDMQKTTYDIDDDGVVDYAETVAVDVRNPSTSDILRRGTIVYLNGSTGNRPNAYKAQADTEATSSGTFGVVIDDIGLNTDGRVAALGTLHNLDTRTAAGGAPYPFTSDTLLDGDAIWLSPTTAGYVTRVKPTAPNHAVFIGIVARTSPTNGRIIYRIQNGYELEELHNVAISNIQPNQVIKYDGTKWINATTPAAGNNTEIQYNNSGSLGASSNFTWDNTSKTLSLVNLSHIISPSLVFKSKDNSGNSAVVDSAYILSLVTNSNPGSYASLLNINAYSNNGVYKNTPLSILNTYNSSTDALTDSIVVVDKKLQIANIPTTTTTASGLIGTDTSGGLFKISLTGSSLTLSSTGTLDVSTLPFNKITAGQAQLSGSQNIAINYSNSNSGLLVSNSGYSVLGSPDGLKTLTVDNTGIYTTSSTAIGTNSINANAILSLNSTTKGLLLPAVNTTDRDNMVSPSSGIIIYNPTTGTFQGKTPAATWVDFGSGGSGSPAGSTGQVQFNNAGAFEASSNFNWDNTNSRLGIGTTAPGASLQINGAGATSGTSSLLINNSGASELFRVSDNGLISVGKNVSVSTQSSSQIQAVSGDANTNVVITPKGTGAFIVGLPPDGTASGGGNARGAGAIDLQMSRGGGGQIASGSGAVAIGSGCSSSGGGSVAIGISCASSGTGTVALGQSSSASGQGSFASGTGATATANGAFAGGWFLNAGSTYSAAFGYRTIANLFGSQAYAGGRFSADGDAQTMSWRYFRQITGTGITELSLDGAAPSTVGRAILVSNRLWNVDLQVSAICSTVGNGVGITLGDSFVGVYRVGIKRLVNTTTLVGTVQNVITAQSDTGMSTSVVTITADDTNESLKVEFTPPTTAGSTTVIRVVVTATATVVGY